MADALSVVLGETLMSEYAREEILELIEENGGPGGLDLSQYANLQRADLSDANLHGAYLSGANLQEASLSGAALQEADLGYANLQRADLRYANLQRAYLAGANLQGALLVGTNLHEAIYDDDATIWPNGFTPPLSR